MNTHNVNVKTATPESPKTWMNGLQQRFSAARDRADQDVAEAIQAHAHYGITFRKQDSAVCWLKGMVRGWMDAR
ncbi:hypothetical protein N3553_23300 [Pantoea dispersa]|uniref:hypothetical protein n=1 Tax=Pantoea TaxID=53335 RepID=UPI001231BCE2|nr:MULTISPECIES: hypothetical protein [Pantoea]KAA6094174.1 hypothetical protein F3I21_22185 [Pantoea sp. B_9]KAA6107038.1 hypothetical protein F3I18_23080 [Pantoea sp. B_10]KAA8669082.1 hypothetical protein F4W08_17475 [Pantoea dispersa]MCT6592797.1 hypothetical protein [Pantoea dispersa]